MNSFSAATSPEKLDVAVSFLRPSVEYVRSQGKSVASLLKILAVDEAGLADPDVRVPDAVSEPLMEESERLCDDPNIGLHIGLEMKATHLGVLGLLLLTCKSARDAFDLVMRYQTLVGNGGFVRVEEQADQFVIIYAEHPLRPSPYPRHTVECCLIGWCQIALALGGSQAKLSKVTMVCDPPDDISEQQKAFGCELQYKASQNTIHIPLANVDAGFFAGDEGLKAALEAQAKQRLSALASTQKDSDPVVEKSKQFVAESIAYGVPGLDDLAGQFAVSSRTLQRQLDAAGKTYKQLVDEVRTDLAAGYMEDVDLSLLDVALMLGFSEQSSFQRAFKRWFDKTPGQYRLDLV
ncbi:MAG: AraC-like DNA-binding protein [Pseudoalteromonas tetraodonis]|jgi:AraC-like DNA-binding protein